MLISDSAFTARYGDEIARRLELSKAYVATPDLLRRELRENPPARSKVAFGGVEMFAPRPDPFAYQINLARGFAYDPRRLENFILAEHEGKAEVQEHLPIRLDIEPAARCNSRCIMCQVATWPTLGPRHLFTGHEQVYEYYCNRVPQRDLEHYLLTYVETDGQFYSYPIHSDDIARMPDRTDIQTQLDNRGDPGAAKNFEDYWINSVGAILYDKFVRNYSKKMWQLESNAVLDDFKFDGKGVGIATGGHRVRPDYFVSYPVSLGGWDDYIELCANTDNVCARTGVHVEAFDVKRPAVKVEGEWLGCDLLVSSISPDVVMDHVYGKLNYIGRDFIPIVLPCEHVIPDPTFFLHYAGDEIYTRVVEYKKLTGYQSDQTLIGIEIPSTRNKLYPYPIKAEQERAQRYIDEIQNDKTISVGRLGNYRYMDIGDVTNEALDRVEAY